MSELSIELLNMSLILFRLIVEETQLLFQMIGERVGLSKLSLELLDLLIGFSQLAVRDIFLLISLR